MCRSVCLAGVNPRSTSLMYETDKPIFEASSSGVIPCAASLRSKTLVFMDPCLILKLEVCNAKIKTEWRPHVLYF